MSAAKHTPGPWAYDQAGGEVYYADGDVEPVIAGIEQDGTSEEQADADGRLIAAAPDLLDACERAEWWLSTHPEGSAMRDVLRAAIAKAEGRS